MCRHTYGMETMLLGMVFGVLTVAMPGPISVSLVQVATMQGRSSGFRAGIGITGGDVLLSIGALSLVLSAGAVVPDRMFAALQLATAAFLLGFGLLLVTRPVLVQERSAEVAHPLRSFLVFTTLMPTAFGSWVATLSAMPFAADRDSLTAFAFGIVVVSALWHPAIGSFAGVIGPRLTPRALRIGTRVGGLATLGLGLWSLTTV